MADGVTEDSKGSTNARIPWSMWLLPIFGGLFGGLVGAMFTYDEDRRSAAKMLALGTLVTIMAVMTLTRFPLRERY